MPDVTTWFQEAPPSSADPCPATLLVVFNSAAKRGSCRESEWSRTASEAGVHVLFVKEFTPRDADYSFYCAAQVVEEVDAAFNAVPEEKRRRVWTMGSSSGGFAALAYGCRYNAHRVFAISPQVDFRAGFYDALDSRRGGVFTRPLRYREEEGALQCVTQDDVDSCIQRDVHIVHATLNEYDGAHIALIEGSPKVTVHPFQSAQHGLFDRRADVHRLFKHAFLV